MNISDPCYYEEKIVEKAHLEYAAAKDKLKKYSDSGVKTLDDNVDLSNNPVNPEDEIGKLKREEKSKKHALDQSIEALKKCREKHKKS